MPEEHCPYVSRGGIKLAAALDRFALDPTGCVCADLGCNVGGFTDCLLQRGARQVYAVDTGYGALAWKLRNDPRVAALERTNALHTPPPAAAANACDLVAIDLGWTRQQHAIPMALRWLRSGDALSASRQPASIITLIKPHYEADRAALGRGDHAVLTDADALAVCQSVLARMPQWNVQVLDWCQSPLRGGAGKGRTGNIEYLAHVQRH
ncbi:MAG: SAM-dependent methyltransferase [Phycisphaeraceae bacterium]